MPVGGGTSLIPAFGKQNSDFKSSLVYIMSFRTAKGYTDHALKAKAKTKFPQNKQNTLQQYVPVEQNALFHNVPSIQAGI